MTYNSVSKFFRSLVWACCLYSGFISLNALAQSEWREYPSMERGWNSTTLPPNHLAPSEFVVGRLMFPQYSQGPFGSGPGNWLRGGTAWSVDYPSGDRFFAKLLARLTTVNVRAVEQPVNLDDGDDAFYWPFMISGLVGSWDLTDGQAAKLREYLLRGGFLLCDSFYGEYEWTGFVSTLRKVFPDRAIIDLPDDHPVFHMVFDLSDKKQIPTWQYLPRGYRNEGSEPHWRAILDDDGRIMVMIAHNNDIADGWQRADDIGYPQYEANLAIRMGVNFAIYALTH
ncbi:MAG: hypothetical protein CMP91_07035 [Gammaproteobacteria bacterium]|nr:hypothetical protein [Gammaproteobacteria bacterium]|tara:strand:+ start:13394 stop:14242 length:849 start_codon:yes stop_codon:yes gene_type:complete